MGRFHYKQCCTTSNITKNSIRDRYKPISKKHKNPLLVYSSKKKGGGPQIGHLWSLLRYLCLFVHSRVQHILCCVFLLYFFVLLPVSLDCPFFECPFGIPLRLYMTILRDSIIDEVTVSVLVSSAVDRRFEPRFDQTKHYNIDMCCFTAKHASLWNYSKDFF